MSARDAYLIAVDSKLDLVKISPNAKPPVCKVMDYGKYKYEQQKREKEARKKQKAASVKEVRLGLNIELNDLKVKSRNAIKFLKDGDKVKVALRFRGRELGYTQKGYEVFKQFHELIKEYGTIEKAARMEGRSMSAFYVPLKEK